TRVLIWGGTDSGNSAESGAARFDPNSNTWTAVSTTNAPPSKVDWTWGWDGAGLYQGGADNRHLYRYTTDAWFDLPDASQKRQGALGGWSGTEFIFWSGRDKGNIQNNGERYHPTTGWSSMTQTGAPSARWAPNRETGWSARIRSGEMLLLGGRSSVGNSFLTNGGVYN